jgi:hypothetical protein
MIPRGELSSARKLLVASVKQSDEMAYQTAQDIRTALMQQTRTLRRGKEIPGMAAGRSQKMLMATDEAMIDAARRSGVPGLVKHIRKTNRKYGRFKEAFDETVIHELMKAAPEKIPDYVRSASLSDIRQLKLTLSAENMDMIRASIVRGMLDKSTKGELAAKGFGIEAIGATTVGLPPKIPMQLSGPSLQGAMEAIGRGKLTTLFGPETAGDLARLSHEATRVGTLGKGIPMIPGLLTGGINVAILSPILRFTGMWGLDVAKSAVMVSGLHVLSRLLVRQPGARRNYRAFLAAVARNDTQAALTAGLVLTSQLERETQRERQAKREWQPGQKGTGQISIAGLE